MKRVSRAERSEANRRAVLDAARAQFEQQGFHGASLDVIAEEAGFSKGAVYSRFASKDDLFLAVLADHIERRAVATEAQLEALDGSLALADLARVAIGQSVATVAWQAALMEFRAYAFRDPELNARYGELHRRTVHSTAGFIAALYQRRNQPLPTSAEQMAVVALATGTGLVAEYMVDPDIDVDGLVELSVTGPATRLADLDTPEPSDGHR